MDPIRAIVFFDGICGLCNKTVDFLLKADRREVLLFCPLQSENAREVLPPEFLITDEHGAFKSIVFYRDGKVFSQSSAILEIFSQLGGAWSLFSVFRFIPAPLRDIAYDLVAQERYKIFGKKESCRLPTPAERKRFLV